MNPNYSNPGSAGTDQEPDMSDPNESSEGEMTFSTADYPELDGLQPGNPVKVQCQGTVKDSSNGQVTLSIDPGSCQFETEGQADKAMKSMSQQDNQQPSDTGGSGEDF